MKLLLEKFDKLTGLGMRLQDSTGASIELGQVYSYAVSQGRQESGIVGNAFVTKDVVPSTVTIKFASGELALDLPLVTDRMLL
jgi:hypothetical protein